ncbi:membrane protein containing DUF6, transmembrane [Candidatus Magnetomorum sp. HK-1]|nr:membrane protein containing DUF6, transmembrane [Candidatus Magnetomorum sp. HK-1]
MLLDSIDYTILALGSAFFSAVSNILARTILKDIKTKNILGLNFLLMTGILALFSPWFFKINISFKYADTYPVTILLVLLIGIIDLIANYFYFKSFENSEASVVTPILSLSPGFIFVFSWFFLDDIVNYVQIIFACLIIIGIIFISTDLKDIKSLKKSNTSSSLIASLLFALSAIPTKYLLSNEFINAPTLYEIRGAIIGLFAIMFFGSGIEEMKSYHFRYLFVRSLFVIIQWLLLYAALIKGSAGISYTLANTTPIFVIILGVFFLKEKLSLRKIIATVLVLILAMMINLMN